MPNQYVNWNGDCWKAWAKLRGERNDLEMRVVNTDHGVGVINRGKQKIIDLPRDAFDLEYEYLDLNREELLRLTEVDDFMTNYKAV